MWLTIVHVDECARGFFRFRVSRNDGAEFNYDEERLAPNPQSSHGQVGSSSGPARLEAFPPRVCGSCGRTLTPAVRFCTGCGWSATSSAAGDGAGLQSPLSDPTIDDAADAIFGAMNKAGRANAARAIGRAYANNPE
jgi:hypothetical protein